MHRRSVAVIGPGLDLATIAMMSDVCMRHNIPMVSAVNLAMELSESNITSYADEAPDIFNIKNLPDPQTKEYYEPPKSKFIPDRSRFRNKR